MTDPRHQYKNYTTNPIWSERTDKTFVIRKGNNNVTVSIHRIKPVYIVQDKKTFIFPVEESTKPEATRSGRRV